MANLTDQQIFEAAVYELSTTDPVMGGPGGVDNRPHQQLANRTVWLKAWIDQQIANGLVVPSDITAAINAHLAATDPHAQYTTNAEVLALITANVPAASVPLAEKGAANGVAGLNAASEVISPQAGAATAGGLTSKRANGSWVKPLDKVSDSAGVVHYKDLVHYSAGPNISGTMKIVLPKSWSNTMLQIRIQGYDYSGGTQGRSWSVDVSGYNYVGIHWYNYSANITGNAPFTSVRLAHDGTRCVILLGTTATVWQYPAVVVTDCVASYVNAVGWDTGWSMMPITSEAGITNIANPITNKQAMAGSMIIHAGAAIPLGYLKTNGAAISRTSYAQLFSVIGATYGAGNGTTTFNLPDTRGEFLRGWDDARGVDAGRARGSWQSDSFRSHAHLMTDVAGPILGRDGAIDASVHATIYDRNYISRNTQATGGAETRPRNLAVQYLIKY